MSDSNKDAGRRWLPRMGVAAWALTSVGCADFSPQVADQRPTYGFTSRAEKSVHGVGLYEEVCGSGGPSSSGNANCPVFYGLLPAALDDADAARLRLVKAELNDSGARWLGTAVALPVGAYALYRGIFGQGEGAGREIARLGLGTAATYSWLGARESVPRQALRLAAVEALSCVMYGSAARYLYERDRILASPATGRGQQNGPNDAPSLDGAQTQLRAGVRLLRRELDELHQAIDAVPANERRSLRPAYPCNTKEAAVTCQLLNANQPASVVVDNPAVTAAKALVVEAELESAKVAPLLNEARALRERIDNAPFELRMAVQRIETASNKAVMGTEADVASLRAMVGNLKLGNQTLSATLASAAGQPPAGSAAARWTAQSALGRDRSGGTGAASSNARVVISPQEAQRRQQELADRQLKVRQALSELKGSMEDVRVFLSADLIRSQRVRELGSCEFTPPGLKLAVDPAGPLMVEPGGVLRLSALGGSSVPSVTLVGATALKPSEFMRTETGGAADRQALDVVLTPAAGVADQDLRLVFRNGDLVEVRDIAIRKAGAR